jgi:hypothetical protein
MMPAAKNSAESCPHGNLESSSHLTASRVSHGSMPWSGHAALLKGDKAELPDRLLDEMSQ